MSNYTPTTAFGPKDALANGDPAKVILGTQIDTEYNNIATAIATKPDLSGSNTWTGTNSFDNPILINGPSGAQQLVIDSNNGTGNIADISVNRTSSGINSVSSGPNISLEDSSSTTVSVLQQSSGQTELWQYNGSWSQIFKVLTSKIMNFVGSVYFGTVGTGPASGLGVIINGTNSGQIAQINGNAPTDAKQWESYVDNSTGALISRTTNDAETSTTIWQQINRSGQTPTSITMYGPQRGALVDITPDASQWTASVSGPFSSTVVMKWTRIGAHVTVWTDAGVLGTSTTAAQIFLSALPAAITPTGPRLVTCQGLEDASVATFQGFVTVNSSGSMNVYLCGSAASGPVGPRIQGGNFSGSGSCGLIAGWSISYSL